jgi:hypothetical protein
LASSSCTESGDSFRWDESLCFKKQNIKKLILRQATPQKILADHSLAELQNAIRGLIATVRGMLVYMIILHKHSGKNGRGDEKEGN